MTRVRNADEFLLLFRRISDDYGRLFAPGVEQIRQKYAGSPEQSLLPNSLEAHARAYIVNALLAALNWRLDARPEDGLPNIVPEAPIRSEERKSVRFLDYLGLERSTYNPLLIVETKRPNAPLPRTLVPASTYSEVICRGLAGESLKGDWNRWLRDLGDHVRSVYARVQKAPNRVVITNGDWLIVFLEPSDAFLDHGRRDPTRVLVFSSRTEIEDRFYEVFRHLEHRQVLGQASALAPGEMSFHLSPEAVERAMHGLHLRYIEQPGIYRLVPVIKVAPVVFLRSRYGAWFRVESPPRDYELPYEKDDLSRHLAEVRQAAEGLFSAVIRQIGHPMQPLPLSKHYEDDDGFAAIPGVRECGRDEFLVATGDKTHYLLPEPDAPDCSYHDWLACQGTGVACNPGPLAVRSTSPRAFFVSAELHHCAHRDVISAKATPITSANRPRCGPRSGQDGQAFCEIWRFEQHLCCRTCTFQDVCTKAAVFQPPCLRGEEV